MYKKLVFCTIVRPYIVYVILPWLRPPESEKANNLPGFGHTLYGGEPHTVYGVGGVAHTLYEGGCLTLYERVEGCHPLHGVGVMPYIV